MVDFDANCEFPALDRNCFIAHPIRQLGAPRSFWRITSIIFSQKSNTSTGLLGRGRAYSGVYFAICCCKIQNCRYHSPDRGDSPDMYVVKYVGYDARESKEFDQSDSSGSAEIVPQRC